MRTKNMVILVRYAEIGIKGKNRSLFERALAQNIEACLRAHSIPFARVRRMFGRIFIETDNPCAPLRHVFGIASFSHAIPAGASIADAAKAAQPLIATLTGQDSFRVSCQRLDKTFALTSHDVCVQLGAELAKRTKAKVKMTNPSVNVEIEIIEGQLHVLTSRTEGPGGMPVGSQGKVIALIENDASVLAALLIMKRGCIIIPALLKNTDLSLLKGFAESHWNEPQPIAALNELDALAAQHRAHAVVVNDTLAAPREIPLNALTLRPLSVHTIEEITHERQSFAHMLATH
jgi:thiamine biosynthesis protein ThiI